MGPDLDPAETVALSCDHDTYAALAVVPFTRTTDAEVKAVPLIVTTVPAEPLAGENDVMVGTTLKVVVEADPAGVVILTLPVSAPVGAAVTIWLYEFTEKAAGTLPNITDVAPANAEPETTMFVPTTPFVGDIAVMLGFTAN